MWCGFFFLLVILTVMRKTRKKSVLCICKYPSWFMLREDGGPTVFIEQSGELCKDCEVVLV